VIGQKSIESPDTWTSSISIRVVSGQHRKNQNNSINHEYTPFSRLSTTRSHFYKMGRKSLNKSETELKQTKARWYQQIRLNDEKYEEKKKKDREYRRRKREQEKLRKHSEPLALLADVTIQKSLLEELDDGSLGRSTWTTNWQELMEVYAPPEEDVLAEREGRFQVYGEASGVNFHVL
jgi:vacuolar-type H+-ATPase subunit I/STV1